jgi:DNA polymerase epsilon subunit 1
MISYDQEEDPGDMLAEHELEVKGMPAMKPIVDIFEQFKERDEIDNKMGFERFVEGPMKLGWLINIQSTLIDDASPQGRSGVELYFLEDDGGSFKATLLYEPYFYIICKVRKF